MRKIVIICIGVLIITATIACWHVKEIYWDGKKEEGKAVKLQLNISLNKIEFSRNDPINLTASLVNTGKESVSVSELGLSSVDLELLPPEGYTLRYSFEGNVTYRPPFGTTLEANNTMSIMLSLTDNCSWYNTTQGIYGYKLNITGEYSVRAIYISSEYDIPVWEGTVYSNILTFRVVS